MQINGCYHWDPTIQVNEIAIAVSRMNPQAPLRRHFDLLLGYIDTLEQELDLADNPAEELSEANATIGDAHSAIEKALDSLGAGGARDFEDSLAKLIELALTNPANELLAVRV